MEFLSAAEARSREPEVRAALDALLRSRALAARPGAAQWRFLAESVENLLTPPRNSRFDRLSPVTTAQLKFALHERLRRHYAQGQANAGLVLTLVHQRELARFRVRGDLSEYPRLAGYCLLVRDAQHDPTVIPEEDPLGAYLERVVAECAEAEFRLYQHLPQLDRGALARWWWEDGPGFQQILARARQRQADGWTLDNPLNPSTWRLLSARTRQRARDRAVVATREYWYLRWWCPRLRQDIYTYRQTGCHTYVLRLSDASWRAMDRLRA